MLTTFFHPDKFGGAERVVFELAGHLARLGQEVTVLTHRAGGTRQEEELDGFRVLRYPADHSGSFAFYRTVFRGVRKALKGLLARERFDILHTHQLLSAFAAFFPRALFKGSPVASFYAPYHQEYETKHLGGRPAAESASRLKTLPSLISSALRKGDRFVLERAKAIIVLSRFSRSQVERLLRGNLDHLHVLPAGVDLDRFKPPADREASRKRLGIPEGVPLLFSVRRLVERMGLEDLIDAAAILARRGVPFHLALGGTGPLKGALESRVSNSPARDHIRFLDVVPEEVLPDWYGASDLFVLPTRSLEGFGMVTLEALASGVPVAGTRVGATAEILEQVDQGLLFEASGAEAMAGHLERLLSDPPALSKIGVKARKVVEAHYGWPRIAEQTLSVYRQVLEGG